MQLASSKQNNVSCLTLSSLRDASDSMTILAISPLPLLDEVPPREASVAAERPGVAHRDDGYNTH